MKRILKWVGLAVLALVLGLGGIIFAAFHGLSPIQDGQKLDGVQVVKDGIVSCYLVDTGAREVALVGCLQRQGGQGDPRGALPARARPERRQDHLPDAR